MAIAADFARLPGRQKVLVFIAIAGLGGLLYWQFVFKSLSADEETTEAAHATQSALNKAKDKDLEDYKKLLANQPQLACKINENTKALPAEPDMAAFFDMIDTKVKDTGVTVNKNEQKAEVGVENFYKIPVSFEITGTFLQLKRFFASLVPKKLPPEPPNSCSVERERIVSIENLSLTYPKTQNGSLVITAGFTAR
jgi:Tfp pilus assembly protein PilO